MGTRHIPTIEARGMISPPSPTRLVAWRLQLELSASVLATALVSTIDDNDPIAVRSSV
jgi:hypothetical protein